MRRCAAVRPYFRDMAAASKLQAYSEDMEEEDAEAVVDVEVLDKTDKPTLSFGKKKKGKQ